MSIQLETTVLEKNLGINVDPELKFSHHIERQVNIANKILGMIRRSYEFITRHHEVLVSITHQTSPRVQ